MKSNHSKSNHFKQLLVLSAGITLPVILSWGQERPGIECGCTTYDKYMEPASKAPSVKQGASPETGYSSESKYVIEAVDALPPNVSNITIYYQGTMIFNESSTATGWGFSPDEDRFLMHGRDQFGSHWCLLANLDPDPSVEGEWSTQKMVVEPTNVSSEAIRFSPHGKYLLYAAISGTTSGLLLNVFDAKTFENVYDGSTTSLVGQPLDGVSVAGWGFSSDIKDATFMHTYLTDVNRYALYVVNLHKRPYQNVITPAEVSYGQAYFRFSPCGDYFAWIWDSPYQDLTCELYRTNSTDSHKDVTAEQFWYLYSDADGQYIKYKDETDDKIDENNADDDCDDVTKPVWENAVLDTGTVEGVQMELEWSGATDAGGVSAYRILKKDELDNYELIKEIEAVNSCWITGLTPLTEYSFKVLAGDEVGNWSTDGPTGTFTTFSDSPPDWDGMSLTYAEQTETRIKLFWNDAHDDYRIKSYRILTDTTIRGMVGKDTLKYTIMGLTAGTEYTFIVEAGDEAGQWLAGLDQLTLTMPQPARPEWPGGTALSNSDITETSFHVSWPEVQDVYPPGIRYKVYMEGDSIALKKFYDRDLYVEDLEAGTSYFFEVVAIDESGNLSEALDGYLSTRPSFVVDTLVFGPGNQKRPDIDDNLVVWWDDRNDDGDIWSYDLITDEIKRITDDPRVQYQPAVSDGRIVWTDNRNDVGDIYMYDSVLQEKAICTADGMQDEPAIEGNIIVWRDSRNANFDIYMYDLSTSHESPVCTHQSNQVSPDVTKDFIVYADDRNGDWDIFLYNIYTKKERAICTRDGDQTEPTITGTNIANTVVTYTDGGDIYRYNLYHLGFEEPFETEVPLDTWPFISVQSNAHFEDNLLVYQDFLGVNDGINHNIYAFKYRSSVDYYGESSFPVSNPVLETDQINPRTSKENIVWQFIRNDNSDIYVWKRPGGSDLSLSVEEITDPVMVGDTLIYNLKVTNLGPNNNLRIKTAVTLPVKAKFVSAVSGNDTIVKEGNNIIWKIDTLKYESEAILKISLLTYEFAVLDLSAITEGEAFETDPSNNSLIETTKVKKVFPGFVGEGGWPALVAEDNGRVHLAYFDDNKLMYAVKKRTEKNWQFRTLGYCANARFIAMAMAPDRSLHIIYSDLFYNYYGYIGSLSLMHHGVLAPTGEWRSKIIGSSYIGSHSLSLDISDSGELYLAWQEARGAASPGKLWFRKTLNGVWQEPQLIDEHGYDHIDLAVDNEDNTHLSFYSLQYGFAYQKWTGDQPGPIEFVEPHWKGAQLEGMVTSIETDENNIPHISYAGQVNDDNRENIKHAWKQGGIWHCEKVDDGYFYSAGHQVALVPDGPVNFGYSHYPSQQIRFSSIINGQWVRQIVAEEITGYQTESGLLGWELDLAMDQDGYGHMAFGGVNYALIPPLIYFNTDPDSLDFGGVATGSTKTLTFTLLNPSDQNINIDAVEIDDPRFSFSKTSFILPRFGEESIDVTFTQDDKGTEVKTRLRIMYNEPSGLMVDIPVEVKAWQSRLVADPERIDFGAVPLNNIAEKTLYIRNDGPVNLVISEIYRSGIPPGSFIQCDFSIASENCDTLSEGEACEVILNFKPTDPGSQGKPLIVKSNDPNSPLTIIGMYGKTPSPNISCSSYEIDFGYCQSGDSVTNTLYLSNIGDAILNISGISLVGTDPDQFSYSSSCTSIDPGDSCDMSLMMSPTKEGDFNATLTITSDSDFGNVRNVYLSGSSSLKELTVSTDLIDFGEVALSENKEVLLELHNAGSYPIIIEAITYIEGADACEFGHEFQFESWNPVAPGGTVTDKVIFHPIYEGNKTAILKIGSNDSDEPVKIVILKGIAKGINPLAASVSADPRLGAVPLPVQFQPVVTGGQPPYAFSWDFDDWGKSTERSPFHEFQSIGTYNVLFTAIDISGDMVTANIEIAVAAEGTPVVIITALPDYGEIPLTVQFTADTTGGVAPLSFSWEFGDGATSTLKDPSHTYTVPGNYIAKVTVADADGATGTDTKEIKAISNNSISGELWNESGTTNIDRANVILYPQENTDDTIQIKLQGSYTYHFPGLESGNYTVLAVPDTIAFHGELPTYLGDKLALFEAEWTSVSGHVTGKDIHLISKPEGSAGTGSISGEMVEGTKKGLTITELTGHTEAEPVPGAYVYLKGSTDGNLKDFDITASDGSFGFNDLINGSYYFVADYQGKPMDAANTPLVLSDERRDIEILATVGAESIIVQDLGTGVGDLTSGDIKVYPVPAGDHIFLLIPEGIFTAKSIRISITDLSGRFVYINKLFDLSADPITLNMADIPEGVFVMQMTDNNIIYTLKVVKMK